MWMEMLMSGDLTGLVAVCLIFGMPIIVVVAALIYKAHRVTMLRETIQYIVDKGQPIPPELLKSQGWHSIETDAGHKKSSLHRGAFLIAIGAGITLMFLSSRLEHLWGVGMLPLMIGLAYLAIWKFDCRNEHERQ